MSTDLAKRECEPCKGGVPPLSEPEMAGLAKQLDPAWRIADNHHLERSFKFDGYEAAVFFTNCVAGIAQEENHHPDILLSYGEVTVTIWTHKIDGLTLSDFIFAAKVDEAVR